MTIAQELHDVSIDLSTHLSLIYHLSIHVCLEIKIYLCYNKFVIMLQIETKCFQKIQDYGLKTPIHFRKYFIMKPLKKSSFIHQEFYLFVIITSSHLFLHNRHYRLKNSCNYIPIQNTIFCIL